jgi:predicted naringenin-chalcone synthase
LVKNTLEGVQSHFLFVWQIDIIITAGDWVPLPSMSAMIANHFKMRSNVRNYSLGGQGCACGVITVELAAQLLKVQSPSCVSAAGLGDPLHGFILRPATPSTALT